MERLSKKEVQERNKKATKKLRDYYELLKREVEQDDNDTFIRED